MSYSYEDEVKELCQQINEKVNKMFANKTIKKENKPLNQHKKLKTKTKKISAIFGESFEALSLTNMQAVLSK